MRPQDYLDFLEPNVIRLKVIVSASKITRGAGVATTGQGVPPALRERGQEVRFRDYSTTA